MEKYKVEKISKEDPIALLAEKISTTFKNNILIGEDKMCFPEQFLQNLEIIKEFEVRDSDIFVVTFPKAGTTWIQEMVWLIQNNLNYKGAQEPVLKRFPYLELSLFNDSFRDSSNKPEWIKNSIKAAQEQSDPRLIKTHLSFKMLPQQIQDGSKTPKIIYVMRNPKDSSVSYYYHLKNFGFTVAKLEDYCEVFLSDKITYGPYWKHIFSFWDQKHLPNLLIIKYEDMKSNLPEVIRKVAKFLNKTLNEEQTKFLTEHLSFESMKKNDAVNHLEVQREDYAKDPSKRFLRAGVVGQYKEELSQEMIAKFDEWIKKNMQNTSFENEYNFSI